MSELIPGFVTGSWQGILAPAGTPQPIVNKLHAELTKILHMDDVKEKLVSLGAEPLEMTPAEFNVWMHTKVNEWAAVVKEAGIRVE